MGDGERGPAKGPFRIATIHGEPYDIAGRRLTPVARSISFGKARAHVGSSHVGGWGGGFVQITPVAVIEETLEGSRRISITDATARALWGMLAAGVLAALLFASIRRLAARWRYRTTSS